MYRGYIKLWRKIQDWEWYQDSKCVHLLIHLVLKANIEDKKWKGVIIKRGQLIVGRKNLAQQTGISERGIRTCLEKLKTTNEVTIKSTNKFSLVTLLNYELYNGTDQQTVQRTTSNRPQLKNSIKNTKNIYKNNFYKNSVEKI